MYKSVVLLLFVANVQSSISRCPGKRRDGNICPRSTNIEIKYKPYHDIYIFSNGSNKSLYPYVLALASSQCCKSSTLNFVAINSSLDMEELIEDERCDKEEKNDTKLTFFFPVYAKEGKKVVFDDEFLFIRLMKSPGPALLMLKSEISKMKVSAAVAIRESWPLFLLIISLSVTVGILGWLMDHSANPSHFSVWFYKGSFEGFWWAMVTITTVGYGDKVPITFSSRFLAILWMFSGAIILSLFTANVTSVLTSNQIDETTRMIGRKIGVLNSKHYFESNLNIGAKIQEFNSQEELFNKLKDGDLDRVLMPNYLLNELGEQKEIMNLFSVANVYDEPFLMGLALANTDTKVDKPFITCLKRTIKHSVNELLALNKTSKHSEVTEIRTTMLFHEDIVNIVYYNSIAIGVITGIGFILDILRYFREKSSEDKSNSNDETEMRRLDGGGANEGRNI